MPLFKKTNFLVQHDKDRVLFTCSGVDGTKRVWIAWQAAWALAPNLRVAAKAAFQASGAPAHLWRDYKKEGVGQITEPVYRGHRESGIKITAKDWSVKVVGKYVQLVFDDWALDMMADDAIVLSEMFLTAMRNAKNWCGETGKKWKVTGHLTDRSVTDGRGISEV